MLRIILGDVPDVIYNTSVYFKNQYKKEWIISPNGVSMIKDVDSSTVLGSGAIDHIPGTIIGWSKNPDSYR